MKLSGEQRCSSRLAECHAELLPGDQAVHLGRHASHERTLHPLLGHTHVSSSERYRLDPARMRRA